MNVDRDGVWVYPGHLVIHFYNTVFKFENKFRGSNVIAWYNQYRYLMIYATVF